MTEADVTVRIVHPVLRSGALVTDLLFSWTEGQRTRHASSRVPYIVQRGRIASGSRRRPSYAGGRSDNLAPALAELREIAREANALQERARGVLSGVHEALLGRRVRRYGRTYQLSQLDVRSNAEVTCYGVTVSRTGQVGTRGFSLGPLSDCELL